MEDNTKYLVIPKDIFMTLYNLDVSEFLEKKANKFDYLSWSMAVKILKEYLPEISWEVEKGQDGQPFMVNPYTKGVSIHSYLFDMNTGARTPSSYFPVLDLYNNPVLLNDDPKTIKSFEFVLNKNIWRSHVKCIAIYTGLGLKLWTREELVSEEDVVEREKKERILERITSLLSQYEKQKGEVYPKWNKDIKNNSIEELTVFGKELKLAIES